MRITCVSELSTLVVTERLAQFGFGVHDEWSGTRDGFVQWPRGHQQKAALLILIVHDDFLAFAEDRELIPSQAHW